MRKWLVEETGEMRPPKKGEYFEDSGPPFGLTLASFDHITDANIIRITEIVSGGLLEVPIDWLRYGHLLSDRFDEWNW
jgi:hypothetical protein